MNRQETIERAVSFMEMLARDDSHGYDQGQRWGERGDYDCSSAVITAWEQAGVPVKAAGASYTGNMKGAFLRCGFQDVTDQVNLANGSGLQRGDVLLNVRHHTAQYLGNGQEAEASINEMGTTTGGQPGDQTGREFLIRAYRNYPWDCALRFVGEGKEAPAQPEARMCSVLIPEVSMGDKSAAVAAMQAALRFKGFDPRWTDGEFGSMTLTALRKFQASNGLTIDGIAGEETWSKLMK